MAFTLTHAILGSYNMISRFLSRTQEPEPEMAQAHGEMDVKTEFHELRALYKELAVGYLELQESYDTDIKKEKELNANLQRQLEEEKMSHATTVLEHDKQVKNLISELDTLRQKSEKQEEVCEGGTSLRMEMEDAKAKLREEFSREQAAVLEEMQMEFLRAEEKHEQSLSELDSLLESSISKNKALSDEIASLNYQLQNNMASHEQLEKREKSLSMELKDLKAHLHEASTKNSELVAKLEEMESQGNISADSGSNEAKISELKNLLDQETEENKTLWDQIEYLTIEVDSERSSRKRKQQRLAEVDSLLELAVSQNEALSEENVSLNHQLQDNMASHEQLEKREKSLSMELIDLKAHLHEASTKNSELVAKLEEMESQGNISAESGSNEAKISELKNLLDLETEENKTLWDQIEYLTIQLDSERRSRKRLQERLREDEF